ncbi:Nuclear transport (karyopherin beta) [Komagataella phaffii CBS 7435]|uniref:Karyopherin, responsible for nuclear import of Spt15p, histones H2A and H2B, and Nap1p n=2 Tax=Komagataella phaffii TaxID=460519 RepID=C4QYY0_KOMPG|nr:Karyopherin, responsible for nuclear import of Spt15p, histones H2A and H2B, and Nap1p [Komagataella phaffii GS115]AOA60917.1 GQ67_01544T0 [Komagataella phaffii]CAH2447280.1 Nuclear transport (karyopherin beta) [Komagataella phaffii CBS 7435]AOA66450.1 GQ68_01560T0 [Komagataella phaffii GS115]CAY68454.1 Karyopherin, responsible for nuclear import of Spt15p, histones H2A and H2B, and Nap1p [Komagataella phaffii GS115]CCA37519.1 Nuclear transport (karyopherin beta) [Komagataella phaffii CBS 7
METNIIQTLRFLASANNDERSAAEKNLSSCMESDPSGTNLSLIRVALKDSVELDIKQASLLVLKRFVPKYWSMGFQSFVGPPIDQAVKQEIRASLLQLLSDPSSKIRSSTSYAIVQIAVVDYPDEWPSLLNDLYELTNSPNRRYYTILGGLKVLHDLFDDLVTDEQFFEQGVGLAVMKHCQQLLADRDIPIELKTDTLKLLLSCIRQLQGPEIHDNDNRVLMVKEIIPELVNIICSFLQEFSSEKFLDLINVQSYKAELYRILNVIANEFSWIFLKVNLQLASQLLPLIIKELSILEPVCTSLIIETKNSAGITSVFRDYDSFKEVNIEDSDPLKVIKDELSEQLSLLGTLSEFSKISSLEDQSCFYTLLDTLTKLAVIPQDVEEIWESDFNEFVTTETGMSIDFSIRSEILDFLSNLNKIDSSFLTCTLLDRYTPHATELANNPSEILHDLKVKESTVFLLEGCFVNESEGKKINHTLSSTLEAFLNTIKLYFDNGVFDSASFNLYICRIILIIPRFLEKFQVNIDHISFGVYALREIFTIKANKPVTNELIDASILISFTYLNHFIPSSKFETDIQYGLLNIVSSLVEDSEEDTNTVLLEALSIIINIDIQRLNSAPDAATLQLIYSITYKDPSNYQAILSAKECLADLLSGISLENYMNHCSKGLPIVLETITSSLSKTLEYSPELNLSLELLTNFIQQAPKNELPASVFSAIFSPLTKLILSVSDDQILQSSSEVFNALLKQASHLVSQYSSEDGESGVEMTIKVISKFLSPELSDSAILNLGDLIITLITYFKDQNIVNKYLETILKSVTVRLSVTKELVTIENLVLIFSTLTLISPEETLDFLTNFTINDEHGEKKSALYIILPIWFNVFEIVRGYEQIITNVKAFIAIFKLGDMRIDEMIVNGDLIVDPNVDPDLIITRSMAKKIPTRFQQITASLKILKLLINELKFQCKQLDTKSIIERSIDVDKVVAAGGGDLGQDNDDTEGWEDLEDVGIPSYEKLKSYIDNDEHRGYDSDSDNDKTNAGDEALKDLLKSFFRDCAVHNIGKFGELYPKLNEEEKKVLTEYVVFDS